MQKRVLDIGNCPADQASITELVTGNFAATVDQVDRASDAISLLEKDEYALALVNRILDRDGSAGMDVIRELKARYADLPVMMITNFEEHQNAAIELGSERGFGKRDLHSESTVNLLASYLR